MKKLSRKIDRLIVFDITDDFEGGIIYDDIDIFVESIPVLLERDNFRVLLKFTEIEDYETALAELWYSEYTDYTIMIDEIHLFAGSTSISPLFYNLFALGRHKSLNIICATQRPYRVNPIVRSQADEVVTFRQTEKRDLELLRELGFDETEVSSLGKYKHVSVEL